MFSKKKQKQLKTGQYYFVWYIKEFSAILRQFPIISEDFRRLPKTPEDNQGCPKIAEDV